MHILWTCTICGHIKSDYGYSRNMVYNNFPELTPTPEQEPKLSKLHKLFWTSGAFIWIAAWSSTARPSILPEPHSPPPQNDQAVMQTYEKHGRKRLCNKTNADISASGSPTEVSSVACWFFPFCYHFQLFYSTCHGGRCHLPAYGHSCPLAGGGFSFFSFQRRVNSSVLRPPSLRTRCWLVSSPARRRSSKARRTVFSDRCRSLATVAIAGQHCPCRLARSKR